MDRQEQQAPQAHPGSSGPHAFVEPPDSRSALALGAGQIGVQQGPASLAVAEASLRPAFCGVDGCGRPREDPIHWPEE